jgi:uncharacterized protein YbjT (DUF2867 family)
VPHFGGKYAVERMIEEMGLNATILRPAYFMSNEHTIKDVVFNHGAYPMPVGDKGLAMVDTADIAEIAALELIRRENSESPLPLERINIVGPDTLTGSDIAGIWSKHLDRTIHYGGDDTSEFEKNLRQFMPSWMAYDMRLMADGFQSVGMVPENGDVERLTKMLGRPLHSYDQFVSDIVASSDKTE